MKVTLQDSFVKTSGYLLESVSISNDKKHLATAGYDNKVSLWNITTKQLVYTFEGHTSIVQNIKFSFDDKYIVSGSHDKTANVWSTDGGKEICTLKGHTCIVWCVDISSDGRYAATASSDRSCKLWDFSAVEKQQQVGNTPTGIMKCIRTLNGHTESVYAVVFTRDVKFIVTGSYDRTLKLWCAQSGNELLTFTGHEKYVWCLSTSLDNKYVVSGSGDRTAIMWNLENGEQLKSFKGHTGAVRSVAISSDNKFVVTSSLDTTAKIWDVDKANVTHTLTGHNGSVRSMTLSSDDTFLFTGSDDRKVKTLDLSSVPNVPGIWNSIRPFAMLRWLVDKNRAASASPSQSSSLSLCTSIYGTSSNAIVMGDQTVLVVSKEEQVLQSFITLGVDDIFKEILLFLI